MKYLEEGLAEAVAQVSVRGIGGLCEGAEIGTIMVGTQRFSVQVIPGAPARAQ